MGMSCYQASNSLPAPIFDCLQYAKSKTGAREGLGGRLHRQEVTNFDKQSCIQSRDGGRGGH